MPTRWAVHAHSAAPPIEDGDRGGPGGPPLNGTTSSYGLSEVLRALRLATGQMVIVSVTSL